MTEWTMISRSDPDPPLPDTLEGRKANLGDGREVHLFATPDGGYLMKFVRDKAVRLVRISGEAMSALIQLHGELLNPPEDA